MSTLLWYAIPIALSAFALALGPTRRWLEHCATEAKNQAELVDVYQDNAARFFRLSDPEKHRELRELTAWAGRNMLDGTKLIRLIVLNGRRRGDSDMAVHEAVDEALSGLSDDAKHAFGRALGAALLASSYQSFVRGQLYRAMLHWLLNSPDREVKDPEQIVYRYRNTRHFPVGHERAV